MNQTEIKRDYSTELRDKYAASGIALSDGSYPIPDRGALADAIQAFGRNPTPRVRAHIIKRARALGATSMLPESWNVEGGGGGGKNLSMPDLDTVLTYGGAVKTLGNGKVGGYLVQYGDETKTDLESDFFTNETDFDIEFPGSSSVYYHHALDSTLKGRKLGKGTLTQDEVGIWIEAQLALRDEYEKQIYKMADEGKLGWSSGTASHLVERKSVRDASHIVRWPLGLDSSLTPTPAEPRNRAISLKSLIEDIPQSRPFSEDRIQTPRDVEDFLREAGGFSRKEATGITARITRILRQGEPATEDDTDILAIRATYARQLEVRLKTGVLHHATNTDRLAA